MKKDWHHLYNTAAWKQLRLSQLRKEPTCIYCEAHGRIVAADIVDHIKAHKGDTDLFFDPDNLQSLCKQHHDSTKQREEKSGVRLGNSLSGEPIDPSSHWYS